MDTLTIEKNTSKDNSTEDYKENIFGEEFHHPEKSNDKSTSTEDYVHKLASEKSLEDESKFDYSQIKRSKYIDYEFKGERFEIHQRNGKIYINHPKWSLVGMGDNLLDAEHDMISDAKVVAEDYIHTPDTELSPEGQKFKKYLLNIV